MVGYIVGSGVGSPVGSGVTSGVGSGVGSEVAGASPSAPYVRLAATAKNGTRMIAESKRKPMVRARLRVFTPE